MEGKEGKAGFIRRNRGILLGIVILAVIVVGAMFFTQSTKCLNFECFQNEMSSCSKATYINEEPEASWGYEIVGKEGGQCVVNVKLLQAKKGELGIDQIVGFDMDCSYRIGVGTYPEKDLGACHGRLKEELQGIVIEKLHTYVLENLIEIEESVKGFL